MKKKVLLPSILVISILVIGILATNTSAQSLTDYPPVVQKIADRFSLKVGDVQSVFDEEKDECRADMYAHFAERLNDLVSEGKITESQKETALNMHEKMHDEMENMFNIPAKERREKILKLQEEFRKWMESEGIDEYIPEGFGKGPEYRRGFGGGYHMGGVR